MEKTCNLCGETKPASEFYGAPQNRDGLMGRCKACYRTRLAESQKRPPHHQTEPGTKRCTLCKETKPEAEFARNKNFHDGLARSCKACMNPRSSAYAKANRVRLNAMQRDRLHKNPERFADYELKKRFGLAPGTYNRMFAEQGGVCAICGGTHFGGNGKRRFAVDHDEATGQIRGLLCGSCNTGIGHFNHDPSILEKAIAYLKYYRSPKRPGI